MFKMILNIDPLKSAATALLSAAAGTTASITIESANTAFQHSAWTVAILAGLVSIVNGIIKICVWYKNRNTAQNETSN